MLDVSELRDRLARERVSVVACCVSEVFSQCRGRAPRAAERPIRWAARG